MGAARGQPIHIYTPWPASLPGGEALVPVDGGAPGVVGAGAARKRETAGSSCQLAPGVDGGRGAESVVRHAGAFFGFRALSARAW